jgi:Glycosyl hydrolases family 16
MKTRSRKFITISTIIIICICIVYLVAPGTLSSRFLPESFTKDSIKWTDGLSTSLFLLSVFTIILGVQIRKYRVLLINIGVVFFILSFSEEYLLLEKFSDVTTKEINSGPYCRNSDTLGFAMLKNNVITSKEYFKDSLIYEVKYSTDENGHRITPPIHANADTKSIVFLGCSFVFGKGLNDKESLPYIVQDSLKNKYKVYNFAVNGYGPHQLLASIENNMIAPDLKYEPKIFIFMTLPDHIKRVLPVSNIYSSHAPKYILDPVTGEPKCVGLLDDKNNSVENNSPFINSEIYKIINRNRISRKNAELMVALIIKSKKLLQEKYPNSQFHVIFWDYIDPQVNYNEMIVNKLRENDINLHLATYIFPDYLTNFPAYCIKFPYEPHPNYHTNILLSNYILNQIINPEEFYGRNNVPFISHFDSLNRGDWDVTNSSFPENGCKMTESQVICKKAKLTLIVEKNNQNEDKKFKGGGISSTKFYKYGEFTVRLKSKTVPGTVTFFNLMNKWQFFYWEQKGINVIFLGGNQNQITLNVRDFKASKEKSQDFNHQYNLGFNSSKDFHDYTVFWSKDSISLKVDGKWACSEKRVKINEEMNFMISHWAAPQDNKGMIDWLGPLDYKNLPSEMSVEFMSYNPINNSN